MITKQAYLLNPGMRDVSREEKMKVYDKIIGYFQDIIELENFENHLESKKIEGLDLERFITEVNYFFKKCQGN